MTTNKDLRRRETDKLGEWIQQAALDDANKRIAELEDALCKAHNEIGCFLIHCKNADWDEDYLSESRIVFDLLDSLIRAQPAAITQEKT